MKARLTTDGRHRHASACLLPLATLALFFLSCADALSAAPQAIVPGATTKVLVDDEMGWTELIVRADRDGLYLIRTTGKIDAALDVFDARGAHLGSSDDVFELDAAVAIPMTAGETVSVEVSLSSGAAERPSKAETAVTVRRLEQPSLEAKVGGATRGEIGPGRPARFHFVAPASGAVLISTSVTGELDTVLSVRDAAGLLIAANDDRTKEDLSSVVAIPVTRGKRYECLVTGFGGDDAGSFPLEISEIDPPRADDLPNQIGAPSGAARSVPRAGLDVDGDWESWLDADMVDLDFVEAGLYRLEIHSKLDSILTVYDAAGRPIRADDDSGRDYNARLVVEAGAGDRQRARLRPLNSLDRGRWKLSITRVGNALPTPVRRAIGPGRVHGLAVAAADFPSPKALVDAVTDAWNFRRFMSGSLGARDEDIRVLLDDLDVREDDLTVPRIRAEIAALAERAGPEDLVVFVYSGHGDSIRDHSSIEPEIRSYQETYLRRDLDRIRARRTIVIIDACNSGSFVQSLAAPNRWIYTSSRVDETSNASKPGQPEMTGGSLFLACFFQELMYRVETRSLSEAFRRAQAAVTRIHDEQHPTAYEPAAFLISGGGSAPASRPDNDRPTAGRRVIERPANVNPPVVPPSRESPPVGKPTVTPSRDRQ